MVNRNRNLNLPPYRPIEVAFLSEQKVSDDLGDVSFWRNNIVAASKRYNHLYVALRSSIRVYSPTYPNQVVSPNLPYTTLTSTSSSRGIRYIDPWEPHAINSLTVGELGFEEVLVSAHDGGDVCVWYTRDLSKLAFRFLVGDSAWGVALHKERRLLAVSANNHLIQIFELAGREGGSKDATAREGIIESGMHPRTAEEEGGEGGEDEGDEGEEEGRREKRRRGQMWPSQDHDTLPEQPPLGGASQPSGNKKRRERFPVKHNRVRILEGHGFNIPNISFLDDPSGRWLVGVSVDGMVILWDILTERPVEKCRMGCSNRGWSALFLRPQAFKPVSNIYEALGKPFPLHYNPRADEGPPKIYINGIKTVSTDYYDPIPGAPAQARKGAKAWDISPDSSRTMSELNSTINGDVRYQLARSVIGFEDEYSDEEAWSPASSDEEEVYMGPEDVQVDLGPGVERLRFSLGEDIGSGNVSRMPVGQGSGGTARNLHHFGGGGARYELVHVSGTEADLGGVNTYGSVQFPELIHDSDSSRSSNSSSNSPNSNSDNPSKRTHSTSHSYRHRLNSPDETSTSGYSTPALSDGEDSDEDPAQPPTSLIFSTTEHNAHLLTATSSLTPVVVCRSPVYSRFPPATHQYHASIDRLNLCHVIPDLSLVIAASQKGRIAIFRLTRVGDVYAMRLDDVLPRDDEPCRPNTALLGVAVGPVQGREMGSSTRSRRGGWRGVERRRRYRIMCVFIDGTVISYEVGRERAEEFVMV